MLYRSMPSNAKLNVSGQKRKVPSARIAAACMPMTCRRPNGAPRFRCRACHKDFSITSGTLSVAFAP